MDEFTKIQPVTILILSTIASLIGSIATDFGKANVYNQNMGVSGTVIVIFTLIVPIIFKEQREYAWSNKRYLILILALIINLPFAIITVSNHYG